ncbi:alpha/beta hydrolase family protein [Desulfosporosinus acididurans]|uniref:Alpha/beta hydrolase family protein n=1 Tax=Desulfosporosinus acididurans TaxID=476652 RepID=A0A0J1FV06_9FIRM|nr:alpha/beta fold hydrolase [Desulfosporosinus acididurans]KLU66828.1 alpha/beta hydrolase family protein [Desulfosporosinus acididurans]
MFTERQTIQYNGINIPSIINIPSNPSGAAVIVHGYGGCKEEQLGLAWRAAELGLVTCAIDLHGHGENVLNLEQGIFLDVEAAVDHCRRFGKVAAIGHSLGGRLSLLSRADFAIGISPALSQDYSETTRKVLKDLRNYRVRLDSPEKVFDILKGLPVWEPNSRQRSSIIFGSRDVPEIREACQELSHTDTKLNYIEGALHSDIFFMEATIITVINQLREWFCLQ